jgi:hypothetical protein
MGDFWTLFDNLDPDPRIKGRQFDGGLQVVPRERPHPSRPRNSTAIDDVRCNAPAPSSKYVHEEFWVPIGEVTGKRPT